MRNGILNPGLYALEAEEAWVEQAIAESAGRHPEQAGFTIYDRADGSPVGTCGLHGIDWRYSRATFGIAIGAGRGRGLGTEATRLTLDWGFHILGLQNVMLTVLPSNAAAIRVYEKAGFKRIGARRNALVLLGERCDEVLHGHRRRRVRQSRAAPAQAELLQAQLAQLGPARVRRGSRARGRDRR